MYKWDKPPREDKLRKNTQNPSFSSSLLDEIYRSIDAGDDNSGGFPLRKEKLTNKQSITNGGGGGGRVKASIAVEDGFRRGCLVEKWMETKVNERVLTGRRRPEELPKLDRKLVLDNDPLSFSSGSSSSDSSFGWLSEQEGFGGAKPKPKPSSFGPLNGPKPVKTSVTPRSNRSAINKQNGFNLFDDNRQTNKTDLIKSKSRALKIYTSLKKVKQPISPGGRLTSFFNSLFANGHAKKSKESNSKDTRSVERKPNSIHGSTCSSTSSFSRSCLSKNSPRSKEKLVNATPRTVTFYPVSVIMDKKSDFVHLREKQRDVREFSTGYCVEKKNVHYEDYEDDDDMASDSSSDLFELDHLAIFKNKEFCEELPVYETTHLGMNRAIARGLIC